MKKGWEEKYKKALADLVNLEKILAQDQERAVKNERRRIVLGALEILDDLERIKDGANNNKSVNLLIEKMIAWLKSLGVEQIHVEKGAKPDPNVTEVVGTANMKGKENKIVAVSLKGYKLQEAVIRPAKVVISKKWTNK